MQMLNIAEIDEVSGGASVGDTAAVIGVGLAGAGLVVGAIAAAPVIGTLALGAIALTEFSAGGGAAIGWSIYHLISDV